jgi:ADP-ribose pyrophosphatase YjhB (NUDIX family)
MVILGGMIMAPRAIVLGVVEHQGRILLEVIDGKHEKGTGTYYRPPGGGIEHGELSQEALIREFQEELRAEVVNPRFLGVLENVFRVEESVGHEVAFLYTVDFADLSLYEREMLPLIEGDVHADAVWVSLDEIWNGEKLLYPRGLDDLLRQSVTV